MIDTVKVYHKLEYPLEWDQFDRQRVRVDDQRGKVVYHWRQAGPVRITWRQPSHDPGYIYCEFSVAQMSTKARRQNLDDPDVLDVFDRVNDVVCKHGDLPHVRLWTVSRLDYAWNLAAPPVAAYLSMISGLQLSGYSRHTYDPGEGVVFKNGSGTRWIKFYDKDARLGDGIVSHSLRMEVSMKGYAVRRLAKTLFGTEPQLYQYAHQGRALYVLAYYLYKLGLLTHDGYHTDALLMERVRERYGTSANTALGALHLLRTHGRDVLTHGLMSESSYYLWRKRLSAAGFLAHTEEALPPLLLPLASFAQQEARNVGIDWPGAPHPQKKYLDFLPELFGVERWEIPRSMCEDWYDLT